MQIDPSILDMAAKLGPWGIILVISYLVFKNGFPSIPPSITPSPVLPTTPVSPAVSPTGQPTSIDATGRPLVDLLAAAIAAALDARGIPRLPFKLPFGDLPPGDAPAAPGARVEQLKAARDEYEAMRQHFAGGQAKT